jgi:hypothetical protein
MWRGAPTLDPRLNFAIARGGEKSTRIHDETGGAGGSSAVASAMANGSQPSAAAFRRLRGKVGAWGRDRHDVRPLRAAFQDERDRALDGDERARMRQSFLKAFGKPAVDPTAS